MNEDHVLGQFAADLRQLRRLAGSPSYREMGRREHYSASVLSQAASGRALPTLAATLAFVRACNGPCDEWAMRWRVLADRAGEHGKERGSDEPQRDEPQRPGAAGADPAGAAHPAATPAAAAGPAGQGRLRAALRAPAWRIGLPAAGAAVAAAAAILASSLLSSPSSPDPALSAGATSSPAPQRSGTAESDPVVDGADPKRSGCATDGVTLASRDLVYPKGRLAGTVELRYSRHCHMAWTRFTPTPATGRGPGDTVTVHIVRPADSAHLQFTMTYGDLPVYGDILSVTRGCVIAQASITTQGMASPTVATTCEDGPR